MTHYRRMKAPERDQTETIAAVREFEVFFDRYPNSMLTPEVRGNWREARSRLSQASYKVGLYYFRARWYSGRHRPLQGGPQRRPRIPRAGRRLLLSGGISPQDR